MIKVIGFVAKMHVRLLGGILSVIWWICISVPARIAANLISIILFSPEDDLPTDRENDPLRDAPYGPRARHLANAA